MNNTTQLKNIWSKAVKLYQNGYRDHRSFFDAEESKFLESAKISPAEVFDFAEDYATAGVPDFETFAKVHEVRTAYLDEEQEGQSNPKTVDLSTYPEAYETHQDIGYLPRITEKARTKLTGELNPAIMYTCGNDRHFLKTHDLESADFLQKVWETNADLDRLADWIYSREATTAQSA